MIKVTKDIVVELLEQKIHAFFKIKSKSARLAYWRSRNYKGPAGNWSCPLCAMYECAVCPEADLCDSVGLFMYKYELGAITLRQLKESVLADLAELKQHVKENKKK